MAQGTYPSLLASGVNYLTRFDQFDLFAGESDIVTSQAQAADGQGGCVGDGDAQGNVRAKCHSLALRLRDDVRAREHCDLCDSTGTCRV